MKSRASQKRLLTDELLYRFPQKDRKGLISHILHGDVRVNGHREYNPKALVLSDADIDLRSSTAGYVSRGGEKLESVLQEAYRAGFDYPGRILLDAGASTGGFTDCLLRHGTKGVHTVDVGYNQLDYRLRRDDRVYVHERCNIMSLSLKDLNPQPDFAVADLSFRSVVGAASHIIGLLKEPLLLMLIKPQFELPYSGIDLPDFSGVLKDDEILSRILDNVVYRLERDGIAIRELWPSGLSGNKGNREFFGLLELL